MKRHADSALDAKEAIPSKKRKLDINSGTICTEFSLDIEDAIPSKKRKLDINSAPVDPSIALPVEIWKKIAPSPHSSDHTDIQYKTSNCKDTEDILSCQTALLMASKGLYDSIVKIWREDAAQQWPNFYQKVLANMKTKIFIQKYPQMRKFGCTALEWDEDSISPRFETPSEGCPLCEGELDYSGLYDSILTCVDCVLEHGEDWKIEWKLPWGEIPDFVLCDVCHQNKVDDDSDYAFTCRNCEKKFCKECGENNRYNGCVHSDQDEAFCDKCAVDCGHCADWGALVGDTCNNCDAPICTRCEDRADCD